MAAKTPPPRPNKNADGQPKAPAANPTGGPSAAPPPGHAPSLVPPGGPPPIGSWAPSAGMGQRSDARTQTNFKDLPPLGQAQAEEQMGLNPAAPLQMIQGQLASSMQTPDQGPIPANAVGPMMPPGTENFPHDMAALTNVMSRGYAPGADNAEHAMAQNAHALARATEAHAQNAAAAAVHQQGATNMLQQLLQMLALHASAQPGQSAPPGAAQAPPGLPPQAAGSSGQGAPQLSSSY